MVVLTVKYTVQPGQMEKVIGYLREIGKIVKETEPACSMYRVHTIADQADAILLYEAYDDEQALEAHRATPHFKEIIEGKVIPLLVKRDREMLNLLVDVSR